MTGVTSIRFGFLFDPLKQNLWEATMIGASKESDVARLKEIIASVRPLAAEYYRLTKKSLGVTGEVAEYFAAEYLGLKLAVARTNGYDAIRETP